MEFACTNLTSLVGIRSRNPPSTSWKRKTKVEMTCTLTSRPNLQVGTATKPAQATKLTMARRTPIRDTRTVFILSLAKSCAFMSLKYDETFFQGMEVHYLI